MSRKTKIPKGQDTLFDLTLKEAVKKVITAVNQNKPIADLESSIKRYLSQFVHRQCGGNPVAYTMDAQGTYLACSKCDLKQRVSGSEPLGESVKHKNWRPA